MGRPPHLFLARVPYVGVLLAPGDLLSAVGLAAWPGDGQLVLVLQLPAVSRADGSPGAAILDTCYGAAGVLMWYQRERSLVPCSLMALMR